MVKGGLIEVIVNFRRFLTIFKIVFSKSPEILDQSHKVLARIFQNPQV